MGTNFYLHLEPKMCPTCNHDSGPPPLHIGKSSGGWCFSLHVEPGDPEHPGDLAGWIALFGTPGTRIVDEYGEEKTSDEMLAIIRDRKWAREGDGKPYGYSSWEEFHRRNGSLPGPNGLVRHRVDGVHCIANGEGTWDLIVGEFS